MAYQAKRGEGGIMVCVNVVMFLLVFQYAMFVFCPVALCLCAVCKKAIGQYYGFTLLISSPCKIHFPV